MRFLFGKKQSVQSLAEVLEDGREIMNTEMKKPKYNNYSGREVFIDVAVRIQPDNEAPYEAKMKVSLLMPICSSRVYAYWLNMILRKKSRSRWMMKLLQSWNATLS